MSTTETPPPPPPPAAPAPPDDTGPRVGTAEIRDLARLRRTVADSPYGRHVAGVGGGIARHLDIDPLLARIALAVLAIFGPGLLIYLALWLLVPADDQPTAIIRLDERTRAGVLTGVVVLGGVLAVLSLAAPWHHTWWAFSSWLWLLLPAGAVYALYMGFTMGRRRDDQRDTADTAPPPVGPSDLSTPVTLVKPAAAPVRRPASLPRPRRTGLLLFGPTLALLALAEGVLGLVDVAGAHLDPSAYPALAVAVIGVMLVVGAFVGRAGGLIALGLVAVLAMLGTTAVDEVGQQPIVDTPATAAALAPSYTLGIGSLTLDLTQVADPAALNGRTVSLTGHVGRILVKVPAGTGVDLHTHITGGGVNLFGDTNQGGHDVSYDHLYPAAAGHPTLTVDVRLTFGAIQLRSQ